MGKIAGWDKTEDYVLSSGERSVTYTHREPTRKLRGRMLHTSTTVEINAYTKLRRRRLKEKQMGRKPVQRVPKNNYAVNIRGAANQPEIERWFSRKDTAHMYAMSWMRKHPKGMKKR